MKEVFSFAVCRLDGIKISSVPNLTNKGISSVGEFIFGSSKIVKAAAKLDNDEYNKIREQPSLSSKKSLESSLDAIIEKAATAPKTQPKSTVTSTSSITSSNKVSSRRSSKTELEKLREQIAKTQKVDDFTPPVKSKREVNPKEVKSISSKGLNLSSKRTSSKKPSK